MAFNVDSWPNDLHDLRYPYSKNPAILTINQPAFDHDQWENYHSQVAIHIFVCILLSRLEIVATTSADCTSKKKHVIK